MKKKQWIGLACLAGFVLFLLLSPRQNIMATDVRNMFGPSSPEHWLGMMQTTWERLDRDWIHVHEKALKAIKASRAIYDSMK